MLYSAQANVCHDSSSDTKQQHGCTSPITASKCWHYHCKQYHTYTKQNFLDVANREFKTGIDVIYVAVDVMEYFGMQMILSSIEICPSIQTINRKHTILEQHLSENIFNKGIETNFPAHGRRDLGKEW